MPVIRPALDHDHKTDVVRAVLCFKCNMALGLLEENPQRLTAMLDYIEVHHAR